MSAKSPAVVRATSLERDPLKHNFKNFLLKTWKTWWPDENGPTQRMYEVADWLQYGADKSVTMGFRGLAKSYVTVDYGAWNHYCDPEMLILNLAASGKAAKGNADLYWGMIQGFDWLAHMRPTGIDRYATTAFDVAGSKHEKSESFASMSIFSGDKTGRRADLVTPDDVETFNSAGSETERAELRKHFGEIQAIINGRLGLVKVLGTPQTEDTLYVELANERGYAMRIWPFVYPMEYRDAENRLIKEIEKYGPWLAPNIRKELLDNLHLAGTVTEPSRFDEADILDAKLGLGTIEYDRQMRLFTDAGGGSKRPLRLRDCPIVIIPKPTLTAPLKVPTDVQWSPTPDRKVPNIEVDALNGDSEVFYPLDTQAYREYWQSPDSVILEVDPSGEGQDETAWQVLAQKGGRVFLLASNARLEGFSQATLEAIAADAKVWKPNKVRIEKNYGGGMFTELLRPALTRAGCMCTIEEETAGGTSKEQRIVDSLQALVTEHRLVINENVLRDDYKVSYPSVEDAKKRTYRLTYQFTRITRQKGALAHDDKVDCLASGVKSFLGQLRRVLEEAAQQAKDAWLEDLLKNKLKMLKPNERYGLGDPDWENGFRDSPGGVKRVAMQESKLFPGRKLR